MIDVSGPRPIVQGGLLHHAPAAQPGEKVVHRPATRVLPAEQVDRTAPTGPRPAFKHTYLEQAAAFWPEEPAPPVTARIYDTRSEDPKAQSEAGAEQNPHGSEPEEKAFAPRVDIRR